MSTSMSAFPSMPDDASAWPPADGQCLEEAGAQAVLAAHRHRIRQAIFAAYAAVDTSQPGVSVGHRLARPAELARCCREPGRDGCAVATVLQDGPGEDGTRTIELLMDWNGDIRAADREAERQVV